MSEHAGFRKTRSGAAFSPWVTDFGVPIHAPLDFNLAELLQSVAERETADVHEPELRGRVHREFNATDTDSEVEEPLRSTVHRVRVEGAQLVTKPYTPGPNSSLTSARTLEQNKDSTRRHDLNSAKELQATQSSETQRADPESEEDIPLKMSYLREDHGSVQVTISPGGCDAGKGVEESTRAGLEAHEESFPAPIQAAGMHRANLDAMNKDAYHSKQRSKARRRRARGVANVLGEQVVAVRPAKRRAIERRNAAQVLRTRASDLNVRDRVFTDDNAGTSSHGSVPIASDYSLDMKDVHVCSTAYLGKRAQAEAEAGRVYTAEELVDIGFEYIPWDGITPRPVLSREGRVIAVLVGQPRDVNWDTVNMEMQEIMETTREAYDTSGHRIGEARGDFVSASTGISYGGGQTRPRNLSTKTDHNAQVMSSVRAQLPVRRVANFGNSALQLFAPRLHEYYRETLDALCRADPTLEPNFPGNAFASATFNLGPQTVSVPHRDFMNLSFGLCAITATGAYDPIKGGHIILWELRMVIEFPPGATILIPSAIVTHSNTNIAADERRYSFTQYSAGGLFRWVESGHRPVKSLPRLKAKEARALGRERWERGIELFSFWSELSGEGGSL